MEPGAVEVQAPLLAQIAYDIGKGLVIGVGAGLTTATILNLWRWWTTSRDRREQIAYLRDLITNAMGGMLSATNVPAAPPLNQDISGDSVRYVRFTEFRTAMLVALSSRVPALTYKERWSLEKIIMDFDRLMTELTLKDRKVMLLAIAERLQEEMQSLDWLGLPSQPSSSPGIVDSTSQKD